MVPFKLINDVLTFSERWDFDIMRILLYWFQGGYQENRNYQNALKLLKGYINF